MKAANLALRFLLELCALAALASWGWQATDGAPRWALAVGAPVLMAVLWGTFIAPKAPRRLEDPGRVVVELVVFDAAAVGLFAAGLPVLAVVFALLAMASIALMFAWGQRGL